MRYHPDDFLALMALAEDGGGQLLSERCQPYSFTLKQPSTDGKDKPKYREFTTTGCGQETRFVLPYDPVASKRFPAVAQRRRGAGFVTVCAKDDHLGSWPRFASAIDPERSR